MGLTTTKYFRWDDSGALKLDGTAGSFYAIIKHCLTEAGWSVAFDDPGNFKIALRNSMAHGGSGGWSAQNVIRFNTLSATVPTWLARVIKPGAPTVTQDRTRIQYYGNAH